MKFKLNIKKCILVIIAGIIIACDIYINNCILITSFEQFVYAFMKIEGTSSAAFLPAFLYIVITAIIVCILILLPVVDFGKKLCINIKKKCIQLYPIINTKVYGVVLFIVSIIGFFYVVDMFDFLKNTVFSNTEIFDEYYVDGSKVDITFPNKKRNLIYIFVESLESSNVSRDNGGLFDKSIIPNLEQMALDNINFSNNDRIGGAYSIHGGGWTAAAMVVHTSGIPLKISFDDFKNDNLKFNNVTSLGDILKDNGYNNYLLLGSDVNFGGRKSYFDNHNYIVKDYYSAIEDGVIDEDYYEWWGYEDSKLFDYAKEFLSDISKDDEPFNFTMLTANTHFTDGYLEKSCDSVFDDPYSNSLYCSDNMIYQFIEWVKKQDFYKDTTIVIVGDHLTMQDGFYDVDFSDRTIYNVFINADVDNEFNSKNRIFTALDMFPTTIASIGGNIPGDRLGLGTNLFSDKKTIPEIMGMDKFNVELSKGSNYYYNYLRK